ncbi:MAG: serine/threonine-protein kinase, partial [Polyangiaceae bacterium]
AYDPELGRRVAVKLLHTAPGSRDARRSLAGEARALGKLSHPNVVQVYDAGEHEGEVFVAMELVEGEPLDRFLRRTPRPPWREVLAAFLGAARGIAAAHHKGLVHRDVKPSNILRGKDGRVRVADFGLARASERPSPAADPPPHESEPVAAPPGAPESSRQLAFTAATEGGMLIGTPLYMAPEQHEAQRATAASDQYSLCVALHEGLHGELPFAFEAGSKGDLNTLLLEAKKRGPKSAPPDGSPVPPWIHKALCRGLAPLPEDRYPSVDALIAALSEDPDARRQARRRTFAISAVALGLVTAGALFVTRSGALQDPCEHPETQLTGAWDDEVKGRVRAAFLGTGVSHAEDTAGRVFKTLDRYSADWAAMRGEVCSASRRAGGSRDSLDVRDACLDRRRDQLRALTTLFAEKPDADVVDKASQVAMNLPPVAYCADTEALLARVRPPEDPVLRARVAALEPRVDKLDALVAAGKTKDGLALGEPLLAEAEGLPYAPLRARVEIAMSKLRDNSGDYEAAAALDRSAAISAAEGRDDELSVVAWADLLFIVADRQRRFDEASVLLSLGQTAVARTEDARARAKWFSAQGIAFLAMGRFADAKAAHERALALRESAAGPDHPETAVSLHNLATALCAMGDCRAARPLFERAVTLSEKTIGPEHPGTAMTLSNLGNVLRRIGEHEAALSAHKRALAIKEKVLPPDHPSIASTLTNMGNVLFEMGDYEGALSAHRRALAIKEKSLGPEH